MIKTSGTSPPQATTVLSDVQQAFTSVFPNFNLAPASSNGYLIQEITKMGIDKETAITLLYGGLYNPDVATDVWLDAICKFNNINRKPATSSQVICLLTGLSGTLIPANSQVLNSNGDVFINLLPIVIGSGGFANGLFYSAVAGKIPCDANSITRIVQSIAGWDTVNNPTAGIVGTNRETDFSLRNRRKYSLAINSSGGINSLVAAFSENLDIKNFTVQDNRTDVPVTKFGVAISPHAVYCSIYGGQPQDIAKILATKLSDGCNMNGNTTETYIDPVYNWVTFDATWQIPEIVQLQIEVTIQNSTSYPPNIVQIIQNSMAANFNGEIPTLPAYRMTEVVSSTRFYPSLTLNGVYLCNSLTVGIGSGQGVEVSVPMNKILVLEPQNVIVTIV